MDEPKSYICEKELLQKISFYENLLEKLVCKKYIHCVDASTQTDGENPIEENSKIETDEKIIRISEDKNIIITTNRPIVPKKSKKQIEKKEKEHKYFSGASDDEKIEQKLQQKRKSRMDTLFNINAEDCSEIMKKLKDTTLKTKQFTNLVDTKYKIYPFNTIPSYVDILQDIYKIHGDKILDDLEKRWIGGKSVSNEIDEKIVEKHLLGFVMTFKNIIQNNGDNLISNFSNNFITPIFFFYSISDIFRTYDLSLSSYFAYAENPATKVKQIYYLKTVEEDEFLWMEDPDLSNFLYCFKHTVVYSFIKMFRDFYQSKYNNSIYRKFYDDETNKNRTEMIQLLKNILFILTSFDTILINYIKKRCQKNFEEFDRIIYSEEFSDEDKITANGTIEQLFDQITETEIQDIISKFTIY